MTALAIRSTRRQATLALVAAVLVATGALPRDVLPWPWLLALCAPALLLGLRRRPPTRPFLRALLAAALQLSACTLAWQYAGEIARPAALAGTILPPMVFVTARRQDVDATLGLFLSFCVLLVGAILGAPSMWLFGGYLLAAVVQLRCEGRLVALQASVAPWYGNAARLLAGERRPHRRGLLVASGLALGAACALVAMAVDRSLAALPRLTDDPSRQAPAGGGGPRSIGLPDSFVLDGRGEPLELQGERLIEVAGRGGDVPDDLYLRSGFFEVPSLESWRVGRLSPQTKDASRQPLQLRPPQPGFAVQRLEIVRLPGSRNIVFAPPGACSIYGIPELVVDAGREWLREPGRTNGDVYEVGWQDLPTPSDAEIDRQWLQLGLGALPADFDPAPFQPLLDAWRPQGTPLQQAARIAAGLAERCRYVRREPIGPHELALLNFLHGERIGFCMHFSSAAAILLRMLGVPCRIGVGLYGGEPDGPNARVYGSQHAHAWVEIPVRGRGFVVFDPTPPAERGVRAEPLPTPDAPVEPEALPAAAATGWLRWLQRYFDWLLASPWPWVAIVLALVMPWRRTGARRPRPNEPVVARPARRWLVAILRALAERGWLRTRGTTLEQLAQRIAAAGCLEPDLRHAFTAYQEVRFGGRTFGAEHERRLQRGLAAARTLPSPPELAGPAPVSDRS